MKKSIYLLLIVLLFSCSEKSFDCPELVSFTAYNSNHAYNCGLAEIKISSKDDMDFICEEFKHMKGPIFTLSTISKGSIELKFNKKNESFLKTKITLIFYKDKIGYVFRMQDYNKYKNKRLAEFLIKKMEIKQVYYEGHEKRCP